MFSVLTDANGDIAEQTIDYKQWVGTSETLTTFSPHTFTFTHPNYPTYTINNATVSSPINWRIEMPISTTDLQAAVWGYIPDPSVTVPNSTEDLLVENNNVLDNQAGPSSTMADTSVDDTGFAPTTTQFESSEITEPLVDHWEGRVIIFKTGALKKAASDITAYSLEGGRGRFTVTGFPQAPANSDEFSIV